MNTDIHLIWLGDDPRGILSAAAAHWRQQAPDHKCVVHTSDDALLPEWRPIYDRLASVNQRCDLLRWSILLTAGGWYFDCDRRITIPLSEMEADCKPADDVCVVATFGQALVSVRADILNCQPTWPGGPAVKTYVGEIGNQQPLNWSGFGIKMVTSLYMKNPNWFRPMPPVSYVQNSLLLHDVERV